MVQDSSSICTELSLLLFMCSATKKYDLLRFPEPCFPSPLVLALPLSFISVLLNFDATPSGFPHHGREPLFQFREVTAPWSPL